MLRKASPERVRSRVREEEAEEEVGRNLSCDAAWLPPPASFLNETLPTYSYAEHELILKHESTASTKKETSLARRAAGHFGRIFLGKFNGEFWRSREYNVWELCNKPDYWSYLPTLD